MIEWFDDLTLGAFIVAGGIVAHYLVARLLAARRFSEPRQVLAPAMQ